MFNDDSTINDFRYEAEDPHGMKCPIGAHTRRTNPRDYLNGDGHIVEVANSGHEALEKFRSSPFDIVLLDMVMEEDFDGLTTLQKIKHNLKHRRAKSVA